jgi:putative two-component system response regulator
VIFAAEPDLHDSPPPFERPRGAARLDAALWRRCADTGAHQARIAHLTNLLAQELGWAQPDARALASAAVFHDIGKLGVPRRVLLKPGPLSMLERKIMQTHTLLGALLLLGKVGAWVKLARSIALHHHERWDGRGYPRGLAGVHIPAAARIVAVADVYDALTHARVYRPAFPEGRAIAFMRTQRARHFDPDVIDCFLDVLPTLRHRSTFRHAPRAASSA